MERSGGSKGSCRAKEARRLIGGPPGIIPNPQKIGCTQTQFDVIPAAAQGCDVLVGGGALQIALRTVAEQRGIPCVYASYCPVTLPSAHHPPPAWLGDAPADAAADNRRLWAEDARRWNDSWGAALNAHREAGGLAPVGDVRSHIFSDQP
jgi:vancomycin aglycone glucosyltransferase